MTNVLDFNEFKDEIRGDTKEIKRLVERCVEKVEDYAEKSYQGRKDIHKKQNETDVKVAEVAAKQEEQGKVFRSTLGKDF